MRSPPSSSQFDSSNGARRAPIDRGPAAIGTKSKRFRTLVESETISDGRKVAPEIIDECVATFAPATYSPRINLEHVS